MNFLACGFNKAQGHDNAFAAVPKTDPPMPVTPTTKHNNSNRIKYKHEKSHLKLLCHDMQE